VNPWTNSGAKTVVFTPNAKLFLGVDLSIKISLKVMSYYIKGEIKYLYITTTVRYIIVRC